MKQSDDQIIQASFASIAFLMIVCIGVYGVVLGLVQ